MVRRASSGPGPEGVDVHGLSEYDAVLVQLPTRPRKRPRQTRSVALVDALKMAGREILEREGRQALTIYRLSEYSGVATSSIYEYYPTIESLIATLFEDYRADARQQVIDAIHALPAWATLYDGIDMVLRTGLAAMH
ncbi:MAG: TetR/AcrR family transcriptional regulator, partial [Pseudomonas sp.]